MGVYIIGGCVRVKRVLFMKRDWLKKMMKLVIVLNKDNIIPLLTPIQGIIMLSPKNINKSGKSDC